MKLNNEYKRGSNLGNSYWGKVQSSFEVCRGLRFVTTAGHGGWLVAKGFAHKFLSPEVVMAGTPWQDYLCYEEDCQWAILEKFLFTNNPDFLRGYYEWAGIASVAHFDTINATLKHYYPQFAV